MKTRNLRTLGLAMVAACALSAVAASTAGATNHHINVPAAPSIITADSEASKPIEFGNEAGVFKCESAKYEATVSEKTNIEITVIPTLTNCEFSGSGSAATIDMNHCAFIVTGETDASGDAKGHLECAAENSVALTFKVFGETCTYHLAPQTPKGGVHFTQTENASTGKQSITAEATVEEMSYTKTGGFFCQQLGGTGSDMFVRGAATAQAYTHKESCSALSGTERTTPGSHYNNCENSVQNLEVTTT